MTRLKNFRYLLENPIRTLNLSTWVPDLQAAAPAAERLKQAEPAQLPAAVPAAEHLKQAEPVQLPAVVVPAAERLKQAEPVQLPAVVVPAAERLKQAEPPPSLRGESPAVPQRLTSS